MAESIADLVATERLRSVSLRGIFFTFIISLTDFINKSTV